MSLVLDHSCPWPREGLSLVGLSLASDFFVSLALSLVSSTPPLDIMLMNDLGQWITGCKKTQKKTVQANYQRWSPRGHILKSLAPKVKFLALASRPQVLENWPVLGSRTALFFELLKFCRSPEKKF